MGQSSIKLKPGVDTNKTQALNEAAVSQCNLIRYSYDKDGLGLIQKLGGWTKFFLSQITPVVRALWAWEDTDAATHLAYGTQNNGSNRTTLGVISSGSNSNITPTSTRDSVTPTASTTSGSAVVTITDATTTGITSYDTVYIMTHLSVGGLVLYGLYPCIQQGATTYQIIALDSLGNSLAATSTSSSASVASFATTSGSNVVTVTLNNHGYIPGSTYPVLISTTVGGVTLFGNYIVQAVTGVNTFTIQASAQAASSTSGSINGGNVAFTYSFGTGAIPPGSGFGIGGYGSGGYGTGTSVNPSLGTPISAEDWTMGNWGEVLISCPINETLFQPIYAWDPISGNSQAQIIPQAPPLNDGIFIAMPQRQIVAWGSTDTGIQDPLLLRWCDIQNYSKWISTPTNQAGKFRIATGSKIVGCIQGPQSALVWTDIDIWTMNYIGGELVYGFFKIGTGCGLIARKAMGIAGETIYWMSQKQFFTLSGGGVEVLPCDVWDVVFQQIDQNNLSKIRCAVNSLFNEVTWYFPTTSSGGEVAWYVKYNYLMRAWDYGQLARSAWIDESVLGPPIGFDPNLDYIYQHETSPDADGASLNSTFLTGWAAIGEADFVTFVDRMFPDMKWGAFGGSDSAQITLTLFGVNYPGDTPVQYNFSVTKATKYINPRLRKRLVAVQVASNDVGSFWRIGNIRYRNKAAGKN